MLKVLSLINLLNRISSIGINSSNAKPLIIAITFLAALFDIIYPAAPTYASFSLKIILFSILYLISLF